MEPARGSGWRAVGIDMEQPHAVDSGDPCPIHALPDASAWETLSEIGVDERVETINKIAFMNLNKRTGGRGVANWSAVQTAAHGDSEFIHEQLAIYDAE